MEKSGIDPQDAETALLAVNALRAAQRRALDSGRTVIVVIDGKLVRVDSVGQTVIRHLAPRRKVLLRSKQATT